MQATKQIVLHVPVERCKVEWWQHFSMEELACVVESVGSMFHPLLFNPKRTDEIDRLRLQVQSANDIATLASKTASTQVEEVFSKRIAERDASIAMLREQYETIQNMHSNLQRNYDALQQNYQRQSDLTEQIADLRSNVKLQTAVSPQQMGGVAEREIEELLVQTIACEIEDVSREGGKGDRIVSTPCGMRLLLEVKNVERLHSKNDMEKFRRDIYNNAQDHTINAALLVSLKSNSIPNVSGLCSVEFMSMQDAKVPIVMIASNSRAAIQLAVHGVQQLRNVSEKETLARSREPVDMDEIEAHRVEVQNVLPMVCRLVHINDTVIETRIELLKRLMDDATSERTRNKDALYQIRKMYDRVPWLGCLEETSSLELAMDIVLDMHGKKGEYPKTSDMTAPQRAIIRNAGGMKNVVDCAKKRKASSSAAGEFG